MPAILGQLRALALRKTSRGAEARGLLVRLAKASMESKRPAAGVLYQLAELLVSDREFDTALRLLRKASALSPLARNDARMQQIGLEQWLYDNQEKTWSDHFEIIYPRMTSPRYAELLGIVLEAERERISRWIPLRPGHPIEVDLFPLERFLRAHSGGVLVLGIYDGRVRVPFADLQSLHPRLVTILSHEVAHALLAQATYDRAPEWFHEGLAQHIEMMPGRINPIPDLAQRGRVISLPMIEAILDGFGEPQLVDLAYGEAAWVIHYLEAVHGVKTIRAFADAYSRGLSTEETIREVLDMSVAEFDRAVWDWCIDDAPPSWPTELVRYDRELEGLAKRGGDARPEIVREARAGATAGRRMTTWYQTYNRDVASFKSALRNILGPLSQSKVPKRIACVTLSGQINRLLQDPQALHPPDATVEGALDTAFRHFAAMAQACSRGDTESAQASLEPRRAGPGRRSPTSSSATACGREGEAPAARRPGSRGSGSRLARAGRRHEAGQIVVAVEQRGRVEPVLLRVVAEHQAAAGDGLDHVAGDVLGQGRAAPAPSQSADPADEVLADVGGAVDDDRALPGEVVEAGLDAIEAERQTVLAVVGLGGDQGADARLVAVRGVREQPGEVPAGALAVGDQLVEEDPPRSRGRAPRGAARSTAASNRSPSGRPGSRPVPRGSRSAPL